MWHKAPPAPPSPRMQMSPNGSGLRSHRFKARRKMRFQTEQLHEDIHSSAERARIIGGSTKPDGRKNESGNSVLSRVDKERNEIENAEF